MGNLYSCSLSILRESSSSTRYQFSRKYSVEYVLFSMLKNCICRQ